MLKNKTIIIHGNSIALFTERDRDFISLTDIAKQFNSENPSSLIINWLRNKDTIEFLGVWEKLHNIDFNLIEFDRIREQSGTNRFILSAKNWIEHTGAIGIKSKSGRYGGTYAHKDIALGFSYWLSPPLQLYILQEFQRLKTEETINLDWNVKRTLAKINYHIHTDAIKEHLIPPDIAKTLNEGFVYANEADLLNMALFGFTAKHWRESNPKKEGNIRDYATANQLVVLANMENLNAEFIKEGLLPKERLQRLNQIAIYQMKLLLGATATKALKEKEN